jgi:hypothetical protein
LLDQPHFAQQKHQQRQLILAHQVPSLAMTPPLIHLPTASVKVETLALDGLRLVLMVQLSILMDAFQQIAVEQVEQRMVRVSHTTVQTQVHLLHLHLHQHQHHNLLFVVFKEPDVLSNRRTIAPTRREDQHAPASSLVPTQQPTSLILPSVRTMSNAPSMLGRDQVVRFMLTNTPVFSINIVESKTTDSLVGTLMVQDMITPLHLSALVISTMMDVQLQFNHNHKLSLAQMDRSLLVVNAYAHLDSVL